MILRNVTRVFILLVLIVSVPIAVKFYGRITIHNFVANDMNGNEVKFEHFKRKVLLIVNTATECGFTPQFLQLQELYETYRERGFEIIAFPSDSFDQEPRTTQEVITFCNDNYLIDFPIFEKIDVKGKYQASIYKFLTEEKTNPEFHGDIKWNFEKFIIGKNGRILGRFDSKVTPDDPAIINLIEKALN